MARLKRGPKIVLALLVMVAAFFGIKGAMSAGVIPTPGIFKATKIESEAQVATVEDQAVSKVALTGLPTTEPASLPPGPELRIEFWAWNSQMGCLYAIGGKQPTRGSLFAKHGVRASFTRNDDTEQMKANLISYSRAYAGGNRNPANGVNMIAVMGSQVGGLAQAVNPALAEFNDGIEWVYICGRSNGEDQVMGPALWKANPQAAKGGVVAVVPLEGDADLLRKWIKDNDLIFNPDEKTYDPDAVNIIAASTFTDASDKYIANYCEDRQVVKGGRPTGETKNVCIDAISTWTPADVSAAKGRGGLVRVVSTAEYTGIMPNAVLVLKRWAADNPEVLQKALQAFGEGSAQVLSHEPALRRACEISAQVYGDETPDYWCKYYKGVREKDRQGLMVDLGGSRALTLADNEVWFGVKSGTVNSAAAVYTTFANILVELYPHVLKEFPPADQVINTRYVAAAAQAGAPSEAEAVTFTEGVATGEKFARRSWSINFKTGSAGLTPQAEATLNELLNDLITTGNLATIEVQGHTDNTGTPDGNMGLSEERAFAVKQWLENRAPGNFPQGRITPKAFGQTQPVAPNSTAAGKAKNRRVEVILRGQ